MEGDKGMKERKGRWVNNEQTEGGGGGGGFSRRSEIILTESRGRRFNVRPASRTTGNASGGRAALLQSERLLSRGSLRHYSYIMGCLNRWHCSILINYLTAYIWLLRHLVNGLQQGMSNPILQLERFTNFLQKVPAT